MFTDIVLIKADCRDEQGNQSSLWSITGERGLEQRDVDAEFTTRTLRVSGSTPRVGEDGEWHLFSYEVKDSLPPNFRSLADKHRLRNPIKIAFAAGPAASRSRSKLFATMPLPGISKLLPVHFNAPFILAPDRRSIRLDGDEAEYNTWLRSTFAPPLYLYLLEQSLHWSYRRRKDRWLWWPPLSSAEPLTCSLYSKHFARTPRGICLSTIDKVISPIDAVFFVERTRAEVKLLIHIGTPNLVEIPVEIQEYLDGKIKMVDPAFVKQAILRNLESVVVAFTEKHLTVMDIQDVVRFLLTNEDTNLYGLPLLPLTDGSLATFQELTYPISYYAWYPLSRDTSPFPFNRLIDPDFRISGLEKDYNVSRLDGSAAQALITCRVTKGDERKDETLDYRSYVQSFWQEFYRMELAADDVASFPLVSTTTPGLYVSLQKCCTNSVLIVTPANEIEPIMLAGLECLGAIMVDTYTCPSALRDVLHHSQYSHFTVDNVVRYFTTMDNSTIASRFDRLRASQREIFAQWAITRITGIPENLTTVASRLPIWALLDGSGFIAASQATMLPLVVASHSDDVLHFCPGPLRTKLVMYSGSLQWRFKVQPLALRWLWVELALSEHRALQSDDITPYHRLLVTALRSGQWEADVTLVVPNSDRILRHTHNLYARSHHLFLAAFQTRLGNIVHPNFRDLESDLGRFRLHVEMDFASFVVCASVIHEDTDGERRVERATGLYAWYSETLPVTIQSHQWHQLENFRFIPPTVSQRAALYQESYVKEEIRNLGLFSPMEVLLPKYESVAWTQRALFTPSDRLLVAYQSLGVPTPIEVVRSLKYHC